MLTVQYQHEVRFVIHCGETPGQVKALVHIGPDHIVETKDIEMELKLDLEEDKIIL